MNLKQPTKLEIQKWAKKQIDEDSCSAVIESIITLKERINEAERRIKEEGIVVRDLKGSVIAHPAIKISQDATKLMLSIIEKNE